MPQESGDETLIAQQEDGQEHGDRLAIDNALASLAEGIVGTVGGVEGLVRLMSDPEAPTEIKEHAVAQFCNALVARGMELQQEIDAGNPNGDPHIAVLMRFNPELAEPVGFPARSEVDE